MASEDTAPHEIPLEEFDIRKFRRMDNVYSRNDVYEGTYKEQDVVVKELPLVGDVNQRRMVQREIRIHKKMTLKHGELVVPLVGWVINTRGGVAYILTKKQGPSLHSCLAGEDKQLFRSKGDLPRRKLLYQIAKCMAYMHAEFVIHRDLKPENVLLDKTLSNPRLCDFEFSKAFQVGDTGTQGTTDIGTHIYEAPEMLEGRYGPKVDVFSYGMIVYACFADSDRWKFDDGSEGRSYLISQRWINEGRRYAKPRKIDNFYWDLITRCWHHDPHERPSFEQIMELYHQAPSAKMRKQCCAFVQQVGKDLEEFREFKREKQREMEAKARGFEAEMEKETDQARRESLERKLRLYQRRAEVLAGTCREIDSALSPNPYDDNLDQDDAATS